MAKQLLQQHTNEWCKKTHKNGALTQAAKQFSGRVGIPEN
jgi:hypothetical protein